MFTSLWFLQLQDTLSEVSNAKDAKVGRIHLQILQGLLSLLKAVPVVFLDVRFHALHE